MGALLVLGTTVFVATEAAAQGAQAVAQATLGDPDRIVHLFDEPRHRTVFVYNDDVRVLDVQINAGDRSLQHTHAEAIHLTYISTGRGPSDGRFSSNTNYASEPDTHAVPNAGPGLMRIIALPNSSSPVADITAHRPQGFSEEPGLENGWFRTYRIDLAPGQESPMYQHYNPALIVQVGEGTAHVTRQDGITTELTRMGDFAWRNPESAYRVRNVGDTTLGLVIVEPRGTRMED